MVQICDPSLWEMEMGILRLWRVSKLQDSNTLSQEQIRQEPED